MRHSLVYFGVMERVSSGLICLSIPSGTVLTLAIYSGFRENCISVCISRRSPKVRLLTRIIISSLVIDYISALYELSSDTGVTFIYCNYKESRASAAYIRLAIKQICRRMKCLPHKLQEVYERHYSNASQPSIDELKIIFRTIALQFNSMFLVLDALDECTLDQRADLCEFFSDVVESNFHGISRSKTFSGSSSGDRGPASRGIVKLFVTSRKEPDIERAFLQKSFPKIEIEAAKVDDDISVYTKAQIESRLKDGRLTLQNMTLKDTILTALTTKAEGMYVIHIILLQM